MGCLVFVWFLRAPPTTCCLSFFGYLSKSLLWTAKCSRVSFSKGSPVKKMMNKIEIYNLNTLKVIISIFNCFFILQLVQTGKKIPLFGRRVHGNIFNSIYRHCFCYYSSEQKNSGRHSIVLLDNDFSC